MQELVDRFGWQRYAHKHYESRFTRFYEGYWLPAKFGYDKRRAHFSSLILTGQMTRAEALQRIAVPAYSEEELAEDFEYVATKLDLTVEELRDVIVVSNRMLKNSSRFPHRQILVGRITRKPNTPETYLIGASLMSNRSLCQGCSQILAIPGQADE